MKTKKLQKKVEETKIEILEQPAAKSEEKNQNKRSQNNVYRCLKQCSIGGQLIPEGISIEAIGFVPSINCFVASYDELFAYTITLHKNKYSVC
jgi:hypothetical protein